MYSATTHPIKAGMDCTKGSGGEEDYEDIIPRQDGIDLGEVVKGEAAKCGERNFKPLPNRRPNQASPGEFPWMCLVLGQDPGKAAPNWDKVVATCVVVPETSSNEVGYGTNKVLTATHKINNVESPYMLKVRIIEFDRDGVKPEEGEKHKGPSINDVTF